MYNCTDLSVNIEWTKKKRNIETVDFDMDKTNINIEVAYFLASWCKINYVNILLTLNYIDIKLVYVNIQDNYVNKWPIFVDLATASTWHVISLTIIKKPIVLLRYRYYRTSTFSIFFFRNNNNEYWINLWKR